MKNSIEQSEPYRNRVSTFLRWCGALILVVAALHYMLQGLNLTSEALRFWVMPGFIVFVALCGLFCGYWFGDTKSARVFFGLGTAFVVTQLSQVAAMGRGLMIRGQAGEVPLDMWWDLDRLSPVVFGINVFISLILTVPVAFAAFSILAREQRNSLMTGFSLASATMMLPARGSMWTTILIVVLFVVLRYRDAVFYRVDRALSTSSGIAARSLLWLPLFIMIGRSMFYPVSDFQAAVLMTLLAWMLIEETPRLINIRIVSSVLQLLGLVVAVSAWCFGINDLIPSLSGCAEVYWIILPVAGLMILISHRMQDDSPGLRMFAAMIATITVVGVMLDGRVAVSSIVAIATGIALSMNGLVWREKFVFSCGLISIGGGLLYYIGFLFEMYESMPWFIAAFIGVAALLLASWIETQQGKWFGRVTHSWQDFRAW